MVLTSNRTRELAEALRRRCVYHWIGYPDREREAAIIMARSGDVARETAQAVAHAVQTIRARPLAKPPGIAEAVEWANAATVRSLTVPSRRRMVPSQSVATSNGNAPTGSEPTAWVECPPVNERRAGGTGR